MNSAYLFAYRCYIALKRSVLDRVLRRWPRAQSRFDSTRNSLRPHIFPSREIWLQVQSGVARGLWLRLRIPEEAGFWRGEHEPAVQQAISAIVRPGDIVYDVGAHLGSLALGAARIVGAASPGLGGGRVVAFDADPANIQRLRLHANRNHFEQTLQVVHAAIWSQASEPEIAFRRGQSFSQGGVEADGYHPVLARGNLIHVPVLTLDQFIAAGNPPPHLVKIDVEGGEYEVLLGAANLFATQRAALIVEVHHQRAAEHLVAWLQEFRYAGVWKIPTEQFPRHLFAWPSERPSPFPEAPGN